MTGAACLDDRIAVVGECPLWDERRGRLHWVDMYGPALHGLEPATGRCSTLRLDGHRLAAALAPSSDGRLLVGTDRGLHLADPESGGLERVGDPRGERPWLAFNDARTDPHGALWIGTYDERPGEAGAVLFRIGPDGTVDEPWGGVAVVNGPAFSPDGATLYVADTMAGRILSAPLGPDGLLGAPRPFAELDGEGGPDGLTTDAEGGLWVAHWQGGRVVRVLPSGRFDREILLPVPMTLSCAFGGPGLRTLYVTTATDGMTEAALGAAPLSGRLFGVDAGVTGLPERCFDLALVSSRGPRA